MSNFSIVDSTVGTPPIGSIGVVDAVPRLQPGLLVTAVDNWWGTGEFLYARAGGGITPFATCIITPVFDTALQAWVPVAIETPNTANLGRPLAIAMNTMVLGEYSWFQVSGVVPVDCNASIAADTALGIAASGQCGAITAGKQVLNARVIAAASTTVVKAGCTAPNASSVLQVPNSEGWFIGVYLSGTGIAAGTTVTGISPDGRTITLSANTTAFVNGNVTATYNNATIFYNVCHINRPFAQGQIT